MKRLPLLIVAVLFLFSLILGYLFLRDLASGDKREASVLQKRPILRFALVSDSEEDNVLLNKALSQAQGKGVNFVIGLGDWSRVGTIDGLKEAKKTFDNSNLEYFVTAGDHDLWDSRNLGKEALSNFREVFGKALHVIEKGQIQIVILNNSDIYKGISDKTWEVLLDSLKKSPKLRFIMAHKTPFHPESKHVMGEQSREVAEQAETLLSLMEEGSIDGFFSGDLHFFAKFKSPNGAVKITTVGAISRERNFQGPRFAIVDVFEDYSWKVEDVEIR